MILSYTKCTMLVGSQICSVESEHLTLESHVKEFMASDISVSDLLMGVVKP